MVTARDRHLAQLSDILSERSSLSPATGNFSAALVDGVSTSPHVASCTADDPTLPRDQASLLAALGRLQVAGGKQAFFTMRASRFVAEPRRPFAGPALGVDGRMTQGTHGFPIFTLRPLAVACRLSRSVCAKKP